MKKNHKFHLRIESELLLDLKKQADEQNISISELIRQRLRECPKLTRIEIMIEELIKNQNFRCK